MGVIQNSINSAMKSAAIVTNINVERQKMALKKAEDLKKAKEEQMQRYLKTSTSWGGTVADLPEPIKTKAIEHLKQQDELKGGNK